jgi:hypothetical protein
VAYRAYVDVRFGALKFTLCHDFSLSMSTLTIKNKFLNNFIKYAVTLVALIF